MTAPFVERRLHRKSGALVADPHDYDALPFADRLWRRLPIVDRDTGSWSISRTIALYFAFEAGDVLDEHKTSLTMAVAVVCISLALIAGAMAFGKSYFGQLLTRLQVSATLGASSTTTTAITGTVTDLARGAVREAKSIVTEHTEHAPKPDTRAG